MFERGAATARQAAGSGVGSALREALEAWIRKADAAPPTGHVAVMFTDIVGSTQFTQLHGDAKHYDMVQPPARSVHPARHELSTRQHTHHRSRLHAALHH